MHLIVGHSHSFDAPILRTRELIASGAYGAVRMITALNYTDFLYRPRRPEELDTAQGGGAVFNQAAHQVDIVRLLGGGQVKSVRAATGAWDAARPTEGAYSALLTFESGAFASLTYGGYGHFDSDEFSGWIGEMGQTKQPVRAQAAALRERRRRGRVQERAQLRRRRLSAARRASLAHQHFGTIIVSCERADLRPLPNGVMIYQNGAARLDPLPPPTVPRAEVIDELYDAVVDGKPPLHDGAWAMATLEVCLAMPAIVARGPRCRARPIRSRAATRLRAALIAAAANTAPRFVPLSGLHLRVMNWLTNVVRPKIRSLLKRETPENMWIKCPETGQLVFYKDVEANQFVIPSSNYHMRMSATARLKSMFDGETWFDIGVPDVPVDPLKFRDERRYSDRLKDARTKTGMNDAIKLGFGKLEGLPVVIGVQDFDFMGGSLGMAAGEAVDQGAGNRRAEEHALHHVRGLRRRAHAGGHSVADAAAAHHGRGRDAARGAASPTSWC